MTKTVIHVIASLDIKDGGPSRSVPQSCQNLAKLGISVMLVTQPSKNTVLLKNFENFKVEYKSYINLIKFGLKLSPQNTALIHLQHVWHPYVHIMARIAKFKKIPYIITPRGMLEPWILSQNTLRKKVGLWVYLKRDLQNAVLIHATCTLEKENIKKIGIQTPISIIPNGIDLVNYPKEFPKKENDPKKILFLSRIHKKKGIEFLIEAWSKLDSISKNNWQIEIVGNGEEKYIEQLQKSLNLRNLNKEIIIKKPVFGSEKVRLFRDASLFVLPTHSENFGIVIAEALASYTPVITTKGTPWEELNIKNAGWWIDIGTQPLIIALKSALNLEQEELLRMGINGRKLIEDNYNIKFIGNQLYKLYEKTGVI